MDSIRRWVQKSDEVLKGIRKKAWRQVLKKQCGEGTALGFRIAKGRENITYAAFAGSNAIQDQLTWEEEMWDSLWTGDPDLDLQAELGQCELNPR